MSEQHVPELRGSEATKLTMAVVGTIAGLASMFTVIGIMAYSNRNQRPLESQVAVTPERIENLAALNAENGRTLSTGKVTVEGAMERVVAKYGQ